MKKLGFLLLLVIVSHAKGQQQLSVFEPLLGKTWVAEGVWGDGSLFMQETYFEYSLDNKIVIARSKGFTNAEQTAYGDRNFGIRRYNPDSSRIEFWEFNAFGGLTKGSLIIDANKLIYSYDYQGYALVDIWEFVNDSTYNFTVASYEKGLQGNSFLETQFKLKKDRPLKYSSKSIVVEKVVECSIAEAWSKWTTHEGLKSFFGQNNKVELRPGGAYEIYILDSAPYGKKGGEGSTILSFIPNKMLSFTWNAPPNIPSVRNHEHRAWVVVTFDEMPNGQTKIELVHTGFLQGEDWEATFQYFNDAWPYVLGSMAQSCN